jgi:RNA polymerase sigma-70 factor (ECF subfamily)
LPKQAQAPRRSITYCIVPQDLAAKLHAPLRRHFRDDPSVEVIVEARLADRREPAERRATTVEPAIERRKVKAQDGRRIAEQRALAAPIAAPALPPRLSRMAGRLVFVERLEPVGERAEDIDTARLVARIQGGEQELFSQLYQRYFDRVYSYLRIVMRDDHEAEDGAQQVFLQVLNALPRYERQRGRPFRAWLFVIVRNYAIYQLRKHSRIELSDPATMPEEASVVDDESPGSLGWISDRELLMFVERLPLAQRQVLVLRFMLDLTHKEIAEVLGRSPEDVRILSHRALHFLRDRLTAIGREPERDAVRERSKVYLRQRTVLRARRFALRM